jgi:hypothetical protein
MNITPTEAQEQTALFNWAEWAATAYPVLHLMYHTPNGGSRNVIEGAHLKAQGVKAGVPDIFLPAARNGYHGLYIELKRLKGGRVSIDQARMITALREQGYKVDICHGWQEAKDTILEYLKGV